VLFSKKSGCFYSEEVDKCYTKFTSCIFYDNEVACNDAPIDDEIVAGEYNKLL
jgi:hypothetical protein